MCVGSPNEYKLLTQLRNNAILRGFTDLEV